ncbi:MAG: hypothetical protein ACFFAO_19345 [Candidatus Hermodarchaeota archaeon]
MDINENKDTYENYHKIREAISGLNEILKINFQEKDIYFQTGMDNLEALHTNIIEILKKTSTPRQVRIKLREIEYDEKEAKKEFPFKLM